MVMEPVDQFTKEFIAEQINRAKANNIDGFGVFVDDDSMETRRLKMLLEVSYLETFTAIFNCCACFF
jgi:hypothetical protein